MLPISVAIAAFAIGRSGLFYSEAEGRVHFLVRLLFFGLLDSFARPAALSLIPIARVLARSLPGAVVPEDGGMLSKQESAQHDPSIVWPLAGTKLPDEWVSAAKERSKTTKQPYFLNHQRGCVRVRQAALRLGAAAGTLMQVSAMCYLLDGKPLASIGLIWSTEDLQYGFFTGIACVAMLFVAEVSVGWIKVVGFFETAVEGEWLVLNLLWDVLFHVGVTLNEEVSMRGWLLVNTALATVAHLGASTTTAAAVAFGAQALLFAIAHLHSPGATIVGLANLTLGGLAAALNVYMTGGLAFAMGWHFGWNITMGHLLGLSTSGIPMSSKLVSVVPHPKKAALHGGRFGPEQSPLAVPAYLLGVLLLFILYPAEEGDEGAWERLLKVE